MSTETCPPLDVDIRARDGAVCIYAEKQWIALATMSIASVTDTYLVLRFSALSTPGFTPPSRDWEAGVALGELRFSPAYWMGSPYLAWIIAFDSQPISSMIATAYEVRDRPVDERAFALRGRLGALIWPEFTGGGR